MRNSNLQAVLLQALTSNPPGVVTRPKSLEEAADKARETLSNPGADATELRSALANLLEWQDQFPNPTEEEVIRSAGLEPSDFVVVNANAPFAGGAVGQTESGVKVALVNFQLQAPMSALKTSSVLDANGKPPNPFDGALPFAFVRWIVPKTCFKNL